MRLPSVIQRTLARATSEIDRGIAKKSLCDGLARRYDGKKNQPIFLVHWTVIFPAHPIAEGQFAGHSPAIAQIGRPVALAIIAVVARTTHESGLLTGYVKRLIHLAHDAGAAGKEGNGIEAICRTNCCSSRSGEITARRPVRAVNLQGIDGSNAEIIVGENGDAL